eukprot:37721-Pyramimonas_sp.AAC.1
MVALPRLDPQRARGLLHRAALQAIGPAHRGGASGVSVSALRRDGGVRLLWPPPGGLRPARREQESGHR